MTTDGLPYALWRERLALHAAEASVILAGRTERAADLRDAVHLAKPGDQPGPAAPGAVTGPSRSARLRQMA